jgi:beta-lactamase regulating signal transducer with metallopeptidase domain
MGILFGLVKYLWSYYRAKQHIVLYSKDITRREPCHTILDQICAARGKRNTFRVLEMPGLQVPVLFGIFSPCILMPEHMDITEQEMRYILQHECSHHFHHDILLKNIIKLATIFYWWNPFCILLNQQTDLVLEMRIDDSVTLADADSSWAYMQCMIDVSERMVAQTNTDCTFTMALLPTGHSDLHQRFLLLTTNQVKRTRSLNILLLGITISIYLVSYAFIFEGYCSPDVLVPLYYTEENELTVVLSEDNIYLIDNADGTYDVYFNFEYLETTTSPELYPKDAPVYTKDTCPY